MTPAAARAMHVRQITSNGETITLRRVGAPTPDIAVRAFVTGYLPQEIVGGIQQGDRKIIALADDVTFSPPVRAGDKALFMGRLLNIETVAPRRVGGQTIAYELRARG